MTLPVIIRPLAEADIRDMHDANESIRAGLGDKFVSRVREVLERIEAMPEINGSFGKMFVRQGSSDFGTSFIMSYSTIELRSWQ